MTETPCPKCGTKPVPFEAVQEARPHNYPGSGSRFPLDVRAVWACGSWCDQVGESHETPECKDRQLAQAQKRADAAEKVLQTLVTMQAGDRLIMCRAAFRSTFLWDTASMANALYAIMEAGRGSRDDS